MTGKLYYPDVASYQAGISFAGWHAAMIKATEGVGYTNPYYAEQLAGARSEGAFPGAYHFLHQGNAVAQADYCYAVVGPGVPLMVDHEPTMGAIGRMGLPPGREMALTPHLERLALISDAPRELASNPTVGDVAAFVDRYRWHGGTCHLTYTPEWYWGQLGQPSLTPLADRRLHLVTSYYSGNPEDGTGHGWQPYGGMPAQTVTWQYTSTAAVGGMANVDLNCFRGSGSSNWQQTLTELKSLWATGHLTAPQPAPPPLPEADMLDRIEAARPAGGRDIFVLMGDGTLRQVQYRADGTLARVGTPPGTWGALLEAGWRDDGGTAYVRGLGPAGGTVWEITWQPGQDTWRQAQVSP